MRIFILKICFSETFAFFRIGWNGMKVGLCFLFFIIAAVFVAVVPAEEEDKEVVKFFKASCNFTLNFLKQVATKNNSSNIIFSPASISILLAVLQQGAKENTLKQLENLLYLSSEESKSGFNKLSALKEEKNVELDWGNRCYIAEEIELDDGFRNSIENNFDIGVEQYNFKTSSPEVSADKINNWVREVTHDRITNLIDSSTLSSNTIMLLINAIFFKGNWAHPFKKAKTAKGKFEMSLESSVEVLFMSQRGRFYADRDNQLGIKWLQLPFQNNRFSMVFLLPTKKHRLNQAMRKLSGEVLYDIISRKGISVVKVRIPKFKLSEKVSLVNTLQELGLTDVFSGASNLSGMTAKTEHLQVSEIIHQANVEIDEEGSTSSAATAVVFLRSRTPSLSFVANQPFLFFMADLERKILLFAGKIANPKS